MPVKPVVVFEPTRRERGKVTRLWRVMGRSEHLGDVQWYAPWRRYVFEPTVGLLIFDAICLHAIADFCAEETTKHRAARRRLKERQGG